MALESGSVAALHHLSFGQVVGYGILAGVGVYAAAAGISAVAKKTRQAFNDVFSLS